jgi:nucleotide-binding universal stress UspA family protein
MNASFAVQYRRDTPAHDTLISPDVEQRVAYLNTVKDTLQAEGYAVTAQVRPGQVVESILDTSRHFDLLVMATHGRSGLGRLVLGSVSEAVMHRVSTTMLIAPACAPWLAHKDQGGGYRCILVSLDGSIQSEAILPAVEKLLSTRPGKVVILQVAPSLEFKPLELSADEFSLLTSNAERDVRQYLEPIGERFKVLGATPLFETNLYKLGTEIRFCAEYYHADLIAMATHEGAGVNKLLHGSITEGVLHRANRPMLIVHLPQA